MRFVFRPHFAVLLCACLIGCQMPGKPPAAKPKGYFGETEPLAVVLAEINANNQRIPTLIGSGQFEATIKRKISADGDFINGTLDMAYTSPRSLRMFANKDLAGRIFEIGSNDERFWLIVPTEDMMWTGSHANAARIESGNIPIRPDLILEVLGITPISADLLQSPAPVMRFNNDRDAYMIVWQMQLPDRWAAQKEIWYDRQSKLPVLVLLFDPHGRVVLRAYLSNHRPVRMEGLPENEWPKVATSYDLLFTDTGSKMVLRLELVTDRRGNAPNARSFVYPGPERSGVSNVIDFDEQPPR